ncbi:phage tail protein [Actinobacillus minor]|uniref:phage tail-collar fiber domain-containing protein n=1 Tax=Actinobacillus minor TaxID=51047 RepID=UPI0026E9611C|nr:phage tail protein [Actinobacillus minor]
MTQIYQTKITTYGEQQIAKALATNTPLQFSTMAVGDGNGSATMPSANQTTLVREVYRSNNVDSYANQTNPKQAIFELLIPENEGGFWVREIGLFDQHGKLVAVANCPDTYKSVMTAGSGKVNIFRLVLAVTSSEAVEIIIDNSVVYLTREAFNQFKLNLAKPDGFKYIGQVESFEELRTIEPEKQGQRILVKSIVAGKNLGGGFFYADMNDTTSEDDNRHTVITSKRHRWKRLVDFDLRTITPESDDISSDKTHSKFLAFSISDVLDETGLAAGDYSGVQYASEGRQVAQLLTRGYGLHYFRVNDLLSTEDGNVWHLEKLLTEVDLSHQIAGTSQTKVASEYALGKLNETFTQALNSIDLSDVTLSEKSKSQLKDEISSQVADDAYAKTQGFVQAEADRLKENYIQIAQLVTDSRVDNKGNSVLALTIEDDKSQIAMGITHNGNIYQPSAETKNSHFTGWAVTDSQDNVLLEFNTATAEFATAGKKEGFTTARVFAQTDNEYQLSEQVLDSGEKYVPAGIISDVGICFLKDGDVYLQKGSVTTQVTQRGDVIACEMSGSAVRYVAPRRGLYLTYEWRDGETLQIFEPCDIDGYFLTGQSLAVSADNIATSTTDVSNDKAFTISTGPMWHKEWNDKLSGIKGKDGKSVKETVYVQGKGRQVTTIQQSEPITSDSEQIYTLRHEYASKQTAINAVKAKFAKLKRGTASFKLSLAQGEPDLIPEMPVIVQGFKPEIDSTEWLIVRVTNKIDSGTGFTTELEMELKG